MRTEVLNFKRGREELVGEHNMTMFSVVLKLFCHYQM